VKPGDWPPDDFTWADLIGNGPLLREMIVFKQQLEAAEFLVACQKRHWLASARGKNLVMDLRVPLPAAPVLTVTENDPELAVTWTQEETGFSGVYLERSIDGGTTFTPLANLEGDAMSYDDAAVEVDVEYCYRVRNRRCGIHSMWSNIDCGMLEAVVGSFAILGTGVGQQYQFGDGTTNNRNSLTFVDSAPDYIQVRAGEVDSHFLKADGTIWGCGTNGRGNIGDGTLTTRTTPIQIGTDTDWTDIYPGGRDHTIAKKSGGTFYGWGDNGLGQLGVGDFQDKWSPVILGVSTGWAVLGLGYTHTLAIKSDGTLWSCGDNTQGMLGQGDFGFLTRRHTFTQIGTDTDWAFCCGGWQHSIAIKTNGTLWAWGRNTSGQFGDGTITTRSTTPLQIGTDTDWVFAACLHDASLAIKTDGTLWSAGDDFAGELGQGASGFSQPTYTQIGTDTDWEIVECGDYHTIARKTTGALYGWGNNSSGELGLGDNSDRDVPTQIGTDTDWGDIGVGDYHSIVLKAP
jgi:alpha-tubulin suppressor-like RCC1 family protein